MLATKPMMMIVLQEGKIIIEHGALPGSFGGRTFPEAVRDAVIRRVGVAHAADVQHGRDSLHMAGSVTAIRRPAPGENSCWLRLQLHH